MAQAYTRQSSLADGDTITAALFNNEYNQLLNAFSYSSSSASSTGHRHDGTAGQGGNIPQIGDLDFLNKIVVDSTNNRWGVFVEVSSAAVEQIRIQDGAIVPVTDNDIDLGTSSLEFKDAYFDGTVTTDALVADTADINGGTVDGAVIGGSSAAAITGTTITGTAITGTSFVIGSADISEAELETIDGVTAGTVAASKAVVVDSNKDIGSFRNITLTGELDAGSLDVSGDADIDGTLETDALSINGTAVTSTAAELNILDGVTSTAAELNILDGVTSTAAELNILDGVTASATDLNLIDGITNGTVIASKAIITDSNKDITGGRNITISGELDAATLDISGDADIDGTLEADAITIAGVTLAETISDTVGAMVSGNTETGVTVTYNDSDNTLDFVFTGSADTTGNAATATALETARTIHGVSFDGTANIDLSEVIQDTVGAMVSSNTESGITVAYEDSDGTLDFTVGTLNQDTTGLAGTATALATARTIHGVSFDGTANIDLSEVIQDTVGAMVSSNTETGIGVSYEDGDGTLDFVIGSGAITNAMLAGSIANAKLANSAITVSDGSNSTATSLGGTITFSGTSNEVEVGESSGTVTVGLPAATQITTSLGVGGGSTNGVQISQGAIAIKNGGSQSYVDFYCESSNAHYARLQAPAHSAFSGNITLTLPATTDTLVGKTTTDTLTNKTLTAPAVTGTATFAGDVNVDSGLLFADVSANRVGINQASPDVSLDLGANTDAVHMPVGTTAQRPGSPAAGYFRYNSTTSKFEGYTDEWGSIAGGGGGTNMDTNIYAGDGSDTTFTLSTAPDTEQNLMVFIDGVFQAHDTYSVSGTTLTFATAPANGRVITAYHSTTTVGGSNNTINTMTGDGSDTTLTLSVAPVHENNVQVFFDGVYQSKSNYAISGTTLTFSTAPPDDVLVEAITNTNTSSTTANQLLDADSDTKVSVEKSSDSDTIAFDIAGTEVLTIAEGASNTEIKFKGTAPALIIGDAGAEDTKIVFDGNAQDYYIGLDDSADDLVIGKGSAVGTTPAIVIDEDLNVMIAKTSSSSSNVGFETSQTGNTAITRDGGQPLLLNRLSSDGDLVLFRKDGSTVGSIGTAGSDLNINGPSGHSGIRFQASSLIPRLNGSDSSGTIDLGYDDGGTVYRFKDALLTGVLEAGAGSASAPSVRGTDSNTGLFFPSGGVTAITRNGVEGMRMNADGVLLVGATATGRTTAGHEQHPSGFARHTRSGDKALELVRTSSDGEVFEIFKDSTLKQTMGTASNSIFSDEKVKKDIKSLDLGLNLIKKLNPTEYRHILDDEGSPKSFGLIAQEFEKSLEEVGVEKNSTYLLQHKPSEGDTNSDYWLDYLKLTPVLVKAIQELSAKNDALEARLKTLEDA